MVEIVIEYDQGTQEYKIYEPTTDTLLVSSNLTEAFVNLSMFLTSAGLIQGDILNYPDISYHFDSYTVKSMIESNVNLLKRLQTAPSGFMISSQKFGGSSTSNSYLSRKQQQEKNGFDKTGFNKSYQPEKRFSNKSSSSFSGKSGFKTSNKKFGGK